nr:glycosyltransferase family 4 protein [Winogradskyella echinorum]
MFIHHSESNAKRLNYLDKHNYVIIDQCAFNEEEYLKIKVKKSAKTFLTVSRIVPQKNIDILIDVFKLRENANLNLIIIGEGEILEELKIRAKKSPNIIFLGFIPNDQLNYYFEQYDCFIVSHYHNETGPLTGIEAMASGLIIASAKTGAMPDRLPDNNFFFENNVKDLSLVINKIKELKQEEIKSISKYNRTRYLEKYKIELIQSQYKNVIFKLLNQTS